MPFLALIASHKFGESLVMQVKHFDSKILSCYFQKYPRLVQMNFIQNWINDGAVMMVPENSLLVLS
jgi:hypothetical protein